MPNNISADDFKRILVRWRVFPVPKPAQDMLNELSIKLGMSIFDMVNLDKRTRPINAQQAEEQGFLNMAIISKSLYLCYCIGYELASGKMSRSDADPYLEAATKPIEDLLLKTVVQVVFQGATSQDQGRRDNSEIMKQLVKTSNDICALGINNFGKIGYQEGSTPPSLSADDLMRIWAAWRSYGVYPEAQNKAINITMIVVDKITQMISLIKPSDFNLALKLLNQAKDTVSTPFLLCYCIGYELASGNMSRADCDLYLMAATKPIRDFVNNIVTTLIQKGITAPSKGQELALETAKLIKETSNDLCNLAISKFEKIGYR